MKKFLTVIVLLAVVSGLWAAGVMQRIVLLDNSVIIGEIVAMNDGVYTINTESVGEIRIAIDKVAEITKLGAGQTTPAPTNLNILDGSKKSPQRAPFSYGQADAASLKAQQERANAQVQSMAMQEDFLDSMTNLSESNRMIDVMSDPEVMDAIARNDYEFLMNNEKMKNLMESSEIRALFGE